MDGLADGWMDGMVDGYIEWLANWVGGQLSRWINKWTAGLVGWMDARGSVYAWRVLDVNEDVAR